MDSPSEFLQQQALYTRTLKTPNAKLLHTYLRKNFRSSSSQIARRWPMILLRLWSQDVRHQLSSTLDAREKAQRKISITLFHLFVRLCSRLSGIHRSHGRFLTEILY